MKKEWQKIQFSEIDVNDYFTFIRNKSAGNRVSKFSIPSLIFKIILNKKYCIDIDCFRLKK